jgi:thioredoxin-like negative regulator of GroEL
MMTLRLSFLTSCLWLCAATAAPAEEPERRSGAEGAPAAADSPATSAPAPPGRVIPWADSLDAARAAARDSGRPILADFTAPWCHFCKRLDRETLSDERVIQLIREAFVAVRIDTDREPALAKEFRVTGLPTVVFLSPTGKEALRVEGFRAPAEFLAAARRAADLCASVAKLRELAEQAPRDPGAQRAYARALFVAGEVAAATGVLEAAAAALEPAGERTGIYLDLGDGLRGAGKLAEARQAYEKATALPAAEAPEAWARAALALARIQVAAGDLDGAVRVLDGALRERAMAGDMRFEALFLRGYAHAARKDAGQAIADLKKARDEDPQGRWGARAGLIVDLIEAP